MADGDRAAIRIHVGGIVRQAIVARHHQSLRSERFVEFDDFHLREFEAGFFQHFAHGGRRAEAPDSRRHTGGGHGEDAGFRREAMLFNRSIASKQQGAYTVVYTRGVASRNRAAFSNHALQFRR